MTKPTLVSCQIVLPNNLSFQSQRFVLWYSVVKLQHHTAKIELIWEQLLKHGAMNNTAHIATTSCYILCLIVNNGSIAMI